MQLTKVDKYYACMLIGLTLIYLLL